ncbi:hypothetical protein Shyhy01_09010 [Streptomyces hygroscopicus subsp. hygroscopicus]|nr:hypothetical protein Shyhy01_09010 [Streptomyces hygroscopicus subsp. hygroscopicus]
MIRGCDPLAGLGCGTDGAGAIGEDLPPRQSVCEVKGLGAVGRDRWLFFRAPRERPATLPADVCSQIRGPRFRYGDR